MSWDEERAGRALRAGLDRVDTPGSRIEVERIVRAGRRSERRSRLVSAVGAVLVVAVGVPMAVLLVRDTGSTGTDDPWRAAEVHVGAAKPASCTMTELTRPAPATTLDVADPTGTVLFGSSGNHLVRWRDGSSKIVATEESGPVLPTAVNRAGVVVGVYRGRTITATPPPLGWVLRDGVMSPLAVPKDVQGAVPHAINEAGDIVGMVSPGTAPGALTGAVVIWPAGSPWSPYVLQPDRPTAEPVAITGDGTVVANVTGQPDEPARAVVRGPDGIRRDLATPAGWSMAVAVGIQGDIVYGTVVRWPTRNLPSTGSDTVILTDRPEVMPVRWNLRTGATQVYRTDGSLAAVSRTGWLLVRRTAPGPPPSKRTLVVVSPGGEARELPAPAPDADAHGVWISDDGRTVHGQVTVGTDDSRPMTWTCT
jgi:hypothetical protein